jgi:hypothetical protein
VLFPILFISPKIPPPLSANSLAFFSGLGSINTLSPVTESVLVQFEIKKKLKKLLGNFYT